MIDLLSVKLNGEYAEVGELPTIENGTFLCTKTSDCECNCTHFVKGYSYEITDGVATRIDTLADYKINNAIYSTINTVCEYLNNFFYIEKQSLNTCCSIKTYQNYISIRDEFMFDNNVISPVNLRVFEVGDLLHIKGIRNNGIAYVTTVNDNNIVVDKQLFGATEFATIYLMVIPETIENIISQMVYYDVFNRGVINGLKSENVGNYSYTLEDTKIGSLSYPSAIVSGLDTTSYKRLRFIQ